MTGTRELKAAMTALEKRYGEPPPPVTDPFEMILLENAAYLVDDARKLETLGRLRARIGLAPATLLRHSVEEIAAAIEDGGMLPLMRAEKVLECARVAASQGLAKLRAAVKAGGTQAKAMLRKYPSVGEPYADRVLLFNGASRGLAPDSNALRVLLRLGFGVEQKSYAASYRSAVSATSDSFTSAAAAQRAHTLLRRHGQELCKRTAPRCDRCPLRTMCSWPALGSGVSRMS